MGSIRLKQADIPKVRDTLAKAQSFTCPLCLKRWSVAQRRTSADMCLDHCHTTGYVRGTLCRNCNGMEGKLKTIARRAKRDGSEMAWLERVLAYWKRHHEKPLPYVHPTHKTPDEKRLLKNKRARLKRRKAKE